MARKLNKNNKPFKTTASNGPLSLINRANILFFDSFTAPDGETLAAHTPDIDNVTEGIGWFRDDADFEIISGDATNRITDPTNLIAAANMTGFNDHHVSTTGLRWDSGNAATERTSLRCRAGGGTNFEVGPRNAGDFFFIIEAGTLRASTAVVLAADTYYPATATANGSTITGTINGGNTISYALAGLTGTEVGIFLFQPNTAAQAHLFKDFKVERIN